MLKVSISWEMDFLTVLSWIPVDNPEHVHPVQKENESEIGSKRFDLNSHSGRYAPIFREKSGIQFIFIES